MSKIQWTEKTWNPVVGCTRVSPGCQHCYAERMAKRLIAMGQDKYTGTVDKNGRWTGVLNFDHNSLSIPLRHKKPEVWFVDSMSDLFHEQVSQEWLIEVWKVMRDTPQHTYQILTKRADVMEERVKGLVETFGILPNVWLGVSVENQEYADKRIYHLINTPAAIRFLSCEPLLGLVDLSYWLIKYHESQKVRPWHIDWVIIGGESGPGARPFHLEWARGIIDECQAADVAVFMKQVGSNPVMDNVGYPIKDHKGGDMSEWPEWLRVREMPDRHINRLVVK